MDRPDTITYYPGDRMRLELEIEHTMNFRWLRAYFGERTADGSFLRPTFQIQATDFTLLEARRDGKKTSRARFEGKASGEHFLSGRIYELSELRGETVGELAGLSKQGGDFSFDASAVEDLPAFRYEEEASNPTFGVVGAEMR